MLILTRKPGESIHLKFPPDLAADALSNGITITVAGIRSGKQVRVGIDAPAEVNIVRKELRRR